MQGRCPRCKQRETAQGHDPCIANLPGVMFACCGHGSRRHKGYVFFENGTILRGRFDVEHVDMEDWHSRFTR